MEKPTVVAICRLIEASPSGVAARLAQEFEISRQASSAWLARLKKKGLIGTVGIGRGTLYYILPTDQKAATYVRKGLSEDTVWQDLCAPVVQDLAPNVRGIWHHGVTEMVNNAIDHSGSETIEVRMSRNALYTECTICDLGEGIFLKIQRALDLYDTREAILELAKGKFTTDPANHSGEGIFFSSKMFDHFAIRSDALRFIHVGDNSPDVLLTRDEVEKGTKVVMRLHNDSSRTAKEVFDKFALPDEFSFAKTIVPVRLAQHEGETLVSRSQAKRLTRRFERFETIIVDFKGVEEIGQAFADEVFRVFAKAHPTIKMVPVNGSKAVKDMINRVKNPT